MVRPDREKVRLIECGYQTSNFSYFANIQNDQTDPFKICTINIWTQEQWSQWSEGIWPGTNLMKPARDTDSHAMVRLLALFEVFNTLAKRLSRRHHSMGRKAENRDINIPKLTFHEGVQSPKKKKLSESETLTLPKTKTPRN